MVDFIVETGVGVANATSLVSLEYANEYFAAHPFYGDQWADILVPKQKNLLIFATTQISGMIQWGGSLVSTTQTLPWPRYGVLNPEGSYFGTTVIPDNLKRAVCEQAYWLSTPQGNPDAVSDTAGVEELKIDVIQIKFGASTAQRAVPVAVARLLRGLGVSYYGSRVRRIQVGLG